MACPKLFPKPTLYLNFPLFSAFASISAIPTSIFFTDGTDLSSHPMEIHSFGALILTERWKSLGKISQITEKSPIFFLKILFSTCEFMSNRDPWSLLPMVWAHSETSPTHHAPKHVLGWLKIFSSQDCLIPSLKGQMKFVWDGIFLPVATKGGQDNQAGCRCPQWELGGEVLVPAVSPKSSFSPLFSPSLLTFAFWIEFSMYGH